MKKLWNFGFILNQSQFEKLVNKNNINYFELARLYPKKIDKLIWFY